MTNTRRRPAVIGLLATALLTAGCGSGASHVTTGAATPSTTGVAFAACMRTNGVSSFPDPNGAGRLTIDAVANGSSVNTDSPAFKHALAACRRLEPAGFTGARRTTEQQAVALRFARCIRAHGVPDFPDPTPGGPLIDTNRIPSLAGGGTDRLPALNAAAHRCGALYGAELGIRR